MDVGSWKLGRSLHPHAHQMNFNLDLLATLFLSFPFFSVFVMTASHEKAPVSKINPTNNNKTTESFYMKVIVVHLIEHTS